MLELLSHARSWLGRPKGRFRAMERQYGAIPYATVDDEVAFLLITSRRSGRWIFPKGVAIENTAGWEVAAQEAYEEAGVAGTVDTDSIGRYRDWKIRGLQRVPIVVAMHPLRVEQQFDTWPEKGQRHRHWAIFPEARRLLSDPSLIEMIARIDRRLRSGRGTGQPPTA